VLTGVSGEEYVMRVLRSRKKWSVAIAGVVVIGTFVAVALGSLGAGFTPTTLVTGTLNNAVQVNHDRVKFQTKDPTDVRVQKIVFAAGGYSGWHHHPGVVIATVASGAVTFTESDCSSTTYGPGLPAGSVFVEQSDVPGQASSVGGATVYATFVAPHADPPVFRIEDAPVTCP
jgi:quercetin dioxygenase-like cupin family protein